MRNDTLISPIHLLYIYIQPNFKSTIEFVKFNVGLINLNINLKIRYTKKYIKSVKISFLYLQ
jgi:hypothetical protein